MAVRFDSTDQLTRTTNLPSITSFTIMAWIYPITISDYAGVLAFGVSDPTFYGFVYNTSGLLQVYNGTNTADGSTVVVNTWYHLAMTCAGTGAGQLLGYLNGVLNITHAGNASVTAGTLQIARNFGLDQFNGRMTGIFVYGGVLTAAEITQQMRQTFPVRTANINGWYPFLTSGDVIDYSGSGNNWTVSGTLTTEDPPPLAWSNRMNRIYIPAAAAPSFSPIGPYVLPQALQRSYVI